MSSLSLKGGSANDSHAFDWVLPPGIYFVVMNVVTQANGCGGCGEGPPLRQVMPTGS